MFQPQRARPAYFAHRGASYSGVLPSKSVTTGAASSNGSNSRKRQTPLRSRGSCEPARAVQRCAKSRPDSQWSRAAFRFPAGRRNAGRHRSARECQTPRRKPGTMQRCTPRLAAFCAGLAMASRHCDALDCSPCVPRLHPGRIRGAAASSALFMSLLRHHERNIGFRRALGDGDYIHILAAQRAEGAAGHARQCRACFRRRRRRWRCSGRAVMCSTF